MTKDRFSKIICEICRIKLNQRVLDIEDRSSGLENKVFFLKTNEGESVLKIPLTSEFQAKREVWSSEAWSSLGLPTPRIFVYDDSKRLANFDYLIETKIDGDGLGVVKLNKSELESVMRDLGSLLKKMHGVKTQGFGFINGNLKGEFETLDFLTGDIELRLRNFSSENLISRDKIRNIARYFLENVGLMTNAESRLLHNDVACDNCIVKNKKLTGLVDLGDAFAGDPMYDVARAYQLLTVDYKDETVDNLLLGYGEFDMRVFNFYLLYHAIRTIDIYTERKILNKTRNSRRLSDKILSTSF